MIFKRMRNLKIIIKLIKKSKIQRSGKMNPYKSIRKQKNLNIIKRVMIQKIFMIKILPKALKSIEIKLSYSTHWT